MRHGARSLYPLLVSLCMFGCGARTLESQKREGVACALVTDDKTLELVCDASAGLRVKRVLWGFVDDMGMTSGTDLLSSPADVAAGQTYRLAILRPPSGKLRFYEEGSCKSEVIVTLELSGREEIIGFKQL